MNTQPKLLIITFLLISFSLSSLAQYANPEVPIDDRVNDLISKMTLAEKIAQTGNQAPAISRLGVKSYDYWSEALHGVARSGLATSFPQAIALSSTWDPELIYEVATAISDEARVKNNTTGKGLTYWSPTINMARDPRWGRAEENYGEDTYLASQIALSFVRGMQGNDPKYLKTVATSKHFACNNIEQNRYGISSDVDERSLREYYLPVFEATVKEGGVFSLMSAYNAVNGVPSPANRTLLTNILRGEWNFQGYVVSDCDAVANVYDPHHYVISARNATAISLLNGTDLNCGSTYPNNAQSAYNSGLITEQDLDTALKRVFKARFLLGEFDPASSVPYTSIPDSILDCQAHRDLALKTAREAIVLLKNENSILPINKNSIDTIAVIGPNANVVQLGGYSGSPLVSVSPLQGIADKLGVDISSGVTEAENFSSQQGIQTEACSEGGSNVGYIENGDYTQYDNVNFGTGKTKIDFRVASNTNGGKLEVFLDGQNGTSLGNLTIPGTGGWQNWITMTLDIPLTSESHSLLLKFTGGSGYLFNINWFKIYNEGDPNPLDGNGRILYAQGCNIEGAINQNDLEKAVSYAQRADVAIVVCGTDLGVADEGTDRSSLDLPGAQDELIEAVLNANPNTIVVLVNGFSLSINYAGENVPAILAAWYDGQAQGTAIADVLFGDYNPAGRLSTTWYRSVTDLPPMNDYDIKNNRTYMYFEGTPLYPFGFGLSYTDFTYSNLVLDSDHLSAGDSIFIKADITNSGLVAGDEVAQLYVHAQSSIKRPNKELKGFKRIHLQPGETQTVSFVLKHDDLKYYDDVSRTFKVENGQVDVYVGSSSADIRLQSQISTTESTVATTYRQNPFTNTEAEYLEGKSSAVYFESVTPGNLCANMRSNTSYILFKNFDFNAEAKQFVANLSCTSSSISIDVVLDKLDGPVVGTLTVEPTSDLNTYDIQSCDVTGITGIRDVYLILSARSNTNCKIDWISFKEWATGLEEQVIPGKDEKYKFNIFPNPTRSNFTASYQLPKYTPVTITVFAAQGNKIKTLKNNSGAGIHQVNLDFDHDQLNPGMYIVKFEAGSYKKSRTITVIE